MNPVMTLPYGILFLLISLFFNNSTKVDLNFNISMKSIVCYYVARLRKAYVWFDVNMAKIILLYMVRVTLGVT